MKAKRRKQERNSHGLCAWCGGFYSILRKPQLCKVCGFQYHGRSVSSVAASTCFSEHKCVERKEMMANREAEIGRDRELDRRRLWDLRWTRQQEVLKTKSMLDRVVMESSVEALTRWSKLAKLQRFREAKRKNMEEMKDNERPPCPFMSTYCPLRQKH